MVFVDVLTRWPEARAIPTKDAASIARTFTELIVARHGVLLSFLSDNGTDSSNYFLSMLCRDLGTDKVFSATYHPQSHGLVKELIGTIKKDRLAFIANADETD